MSFAKYIGLFDGLEPPARERIVKAAEANTSNALLEAIVTDAAQHSIAISLKRIADIMDWAQSAKLRNEI